MGKSKTPQQITGEIDTLQEMKPFVRQYTIFGGNNWAKIDAQIKALDERMDEDDTWEAWPQEEEDEEEKENEIRSEAQYAVRWMEGDESGRLKGVLCHLLLYLLRK